MKSLYVGVAMIGALGVVSFMTARRGGGTIGSIAKDATQGSKLPDYMTVPYYAGSTENPPIPRMAQVNGPKIAPWQSSWSGCGCYGSVH